MSQDRRTSDIWKHFTKVDSKVAKCDVCKKSYSFKTSLTNLRKHINNAHLIYLQTENDTLQVPKCYITFIYYSNLIDLFIYSVKKYK